MKMRTDEHTQISDMLPLYVASALDRDHRAQVEKHLAGCAECQADLALWKAVSGEIAVSDQVVTAPRGLADRALGQAQRSSAGWAGIGGKLRKMLVLLRSQMPLVHREIWPASAAVIGLGFIAGLMAARSEVIYALAPLIAATCISLIYGAENDPAYELALSTPTSPRQILLARLVLVFSYNLGLALVATLGLMPVLQHPLFGQIVMAWLAPMTFLSAAALALSLWIGAPNAISISYVAWMMQLFFGPLRSVSSTVQLNPVVESVMTAYQNFWGSPLLLMTLSALLFGVALWLAGRQTHGMLNPA